MPVEGAHDIIGDRAFGRDPWLVAGLGQAVIDGMLDGGVLPVIKHIPGHGRAGADSHGPLAATAAPMPAAAPMTIPAYAKPICMPFRRKRELRPVAAWLQARVSRA